MNKMTTITMPVDNRKSAKLLRIAADLLVDGEGLIDEITITGDDATARISVRFLGCTSFEHADYEWRPSIPEWALLDADRVDLIFV